MVAAFRALAPLAPMSDDWPLAKSLERSLLAAIRSPATIRIDRICAAELARTALRRLSPGHRLSCLRGSHE